MQTAWITGSASGVGRRLTGSLAQRGYRVLATDVNETGLREAADADGWNPETVTVRPLDVTDAAAWDGLEPIVDEWGRLDLMLNVAGYLRPGYTHETDVQQIDRHLDVNVKGVMLGSRIAAARMVRQGYGHIINVASLAGLAPVPGLSLYSASKFAVRGFSLSLAYELGPHGVAVTVVCPDAIKTPMVDLQVDYPEAAMTFSGDSILTVDDIERVVFDKVIPRRPLEVTVPAGRGALARAVGALPVLGVGMLQRLRARGRRRQQELGAR